MSSSLRSSNNHAAESQGRFRSSSPITDWEDCESTADKWWWDEKLEDPQSYRSKAKKKDLPSEDPKPSKPNTKAKPKHKGTTKEQFKSIQKPRKKREGPNCHREPPKEALSPAKQFLKDSYQSQPKKVDRDARVEERRERQKMKEARHAARRQRKTRQAEEARQRH